jgi:D-arabinose 1-dehydrogenase-like Zn-dependent alcohol dehydrogenase
MRALPLEPMDITRRAPGAHDVQINIAYGVCHSDIHQVRWMGRNALSCVPGHEIVGRVVAVGDHVSGFVQGTWWASAALSTAAGTAVTVTTGWRTTATI